MPEAFVDELITDDMSRKTVRESVQSCKGLELTLERKGGNGVSKSKTSGRLLSMIPEFAKAPLRDLLGTEHPYGLPISEKRRLSRIPRFTNCGATFFGRSLKLCDPASFLSAHQEIFVEGAYDFDADGPSPVIIDVGANIGLASIFFLRRFTSASIIAIESDPYICSVLRENVRTYGGHNVEVVQAAAWDANETVTFSADHADGGRITSEGTTQVNGIRLRDLIAGREIDLLKIDIEGAESRVLQDCANSLGAVRRVFVEYHSQSGCPQELSRLLHVLEVGGFRYHIQSAAGNMRSPFLTPVCHSGFDMQLNIFAFRPKLDTAC